MNMALSSAVPEGFQSFLKRFPVCCKFIFVLKLPDLHNSVLTWG